MTFCTKDMWSGGEAWMGCRGRGIADDLQTSASRHKWWAMVYDIQNCELQTSLQSVIAVLLESSPESSLTPDRRVPLLCRTG